MEEKNNNKSEHISDDQLFDFFSGGSLTPQKMELGRIIREHIKTCSECQDRYDQMLEMDEQLSRSLSILARAKAMQMGEEMLNSSSNSVIKDLGGNIRNLVASVKLSIDNYIEITGEALANFGALYHPQYATNLRSTDESLNGADITSILIDDDENRIAIERDGTLVITLNKNYFSSKTEVCLIPEENGEPLCRKAELSESNPKVLEVKFMNVEPGDYYIALK